MKKKFRYAMLTLGAMMLLQVQPAKAEMAGTITPGEAENTQFFVYAMVILVSTLAAYAFWKMRSRKGRHFIATYL